MNTHSSISLLSFAFALHRSSIHIISIVTCLYFVVVFCRFIFIFCYVSFSFSFKSGQILFVPFIICYARFSPSYVCCILFGRLIVCVFLFFFFFVFFWFCIYMIFLTKFHLWQKNRIVLNFFLLFPGAATLCILLLFVDFWITN